MVLGKGSQALNGGVRKSFCHGYFPLGMHPLKHVLA
jgi:hypothetical protein